MLNDVQWKHIMTWHFWLPSSDSTSCKHLWFCFMKIKILINNVQVQQAVGGPRPIEKGQLNSNGILPTMRENWVYICLTVARWTCSNHMTEEVSDLEQISLSLGSSPHFSLELERHHSSAFTWSHSKTAKHVEMCRESFRLSLTHLCACRQNASPALFAIRDFCTLLVQILLHILFVVSQLCLSLSSSPEGCCNSLMQSVHGCNLTGSVKKCFRNVWEST